MTRDNSANVPDDAFPLVFVPEIKADTGIGDRGHRKQVVNGKFPPADGNLNGRNFWFRSTYRRWQADVLAGRYRRESNLARKSRRGISVGIQLKAAAADDRGTAPQSACLPVRVRSRDNGR